jgi:tungstate transport system ATP-binding protein
LDKVPLLSISDVRVVKNRKVILDVHDLHLFSEEVLAIIGPNGAGKSTLLSVLGALEFPERGNVFHLGQPITKRNALGFRRRTAMVFQDPLLLDGTAIDNVMLGLNIRGHKDGARQKALDWLERFGVAHLAHQQVHTLSGGEAQRVSLARAFVLEPEILLMDEPFSSVDVISRQSLINVFKEIRETSNTTTVLVTHDYREVATLASRVIVVNQGSVEAEGTPEEISNHPQWKALSTTL